LKRWIAFFACLIFLFTMCACSSNEEETRRKDHASASLSAVGDIFLTQQQMDDAKQPDGSYQFFRQLEDVIVPLSQADVTIGNFEGNFSDFDFDATRGSYPAELARDLHKVGFDVLQTANSYSIFNGVSSLEMTKRTIQDNGMKAIGTYVSTKDRDHNQVVIRDANGVRFAFVAFTKGVGNLSIPEESGCSVDLLYKDYSTDYTEINEGYILNVLKKAKNLAPDVIVAAVHWGSEGQDQISETQQQIADLLVNNGVDVVLGSHSHVVMPIERRTVKFEDGTKKDCIIAYGLGDFSAAGEGECNSSIILNLNFSRHGNQTKISEYSYIPISAVDRGVEYADRYSVMMTQEEISLYEGNYFDRVNEDVYEQMVNDLESVRKKLDAPYPPEEPTETKE